MVTRVTGVLRDGSSPSSGQAPAAPFAQSISWPRGEDGTILIGVTNVRRLPVSLEGRLVLTVRRRSTDYEPMIVREATMLDPTNGQAAFAILAGDTSYFAFGRCTYDIWYEEDVGLREQVVPTSLWDLREAVGRPGEGATVPGVEPPAIPADEGILALSSETAHAVVGQNEELVTQTTFNFSLLETPSIYCLLTALTEQTGAATGTYRVRLGGTPNTADGVDVLAMDTTHANVAIPPDVAVSGAFTRPSGASLVKLTARASLPGAVARVRNCQIAFKTVS